MEETKKEVWSLDAIAELVKQTKEVKVLGKYITIKKLPASIMTLEDKNNIFEIMSKGIVEPKLTAEALANIPIEFVNIAVKEIMAFSNLDMEKAEKN